MNSAVFLDRDGVIIQNRAAYVRCWEDVEFLPSSLLALQLLAESRYKIVIVTNQSAIGRGIITLDEAADINQRIVKKIIEAGGRVDGLYVCPHSPQDNCQCRKPLPGLILQAADALWLDLHSSFMIGDALSDIQSGQAAGIHTNILVKTGRGYEQLRSASEKEIPQFIVVDQLVNAVELILSRLLPSGDLF
jgi:D-glycero-D-manno-heptose 1,7-bisphosphate phosphatase